jgi:hypothetical protein
MLKRDYLDFGENLEAGRNDANRRTTSNVDRGKAM